MKFHCPTIYNLTSVPHWHGIILIGWKQLFQVKVLLYRLNGIAVQARHFGRQPLIELSLGITKSKRRSVEPLDVAALPIYNAGERQGPKPRRYVEVNYQEAIESARIKNLLWVLVRLRAQENQRVSGWTGYNILIRNEIEVRQDNIGYLPTGAHQMEPPSTTQTLGVNPFPSRCLNRTVP